MRRIHKIIEDRHCLLDHFCKFIFPVFTDEFVRIFTIRHLRDTDLRRHACVLLFTLHQHLQASHRRILTGTVRIIEKHYLLAIAFQKIELSFRERCS